MRCFIPIYVRCTFLILSSLDILFCSALDEPSLSISYRSWDILDSKVQHMSKWSAEIVASIVVAYGYATYLALYYTYLALFSLLMAANQRNMFMTITWYGKHLIKEGWFFVFFVMVTYKGLSAIYNNKLC